MLRLGQLSFACYPQGRVACRHPLTTGKFRYFEMMVTFGFIPVIYAASCILGQDSATRNAFALIAAPRPNHMRSSRLSMELLVFL